MRQKSVAFCILMLLTITVTFGPTSAQVISGPISSTPIDKVPDVLGRGVDYVIGQIKQYYNHQRAESVGRLIIDLATLAGQENALADYIDALTNNPLDARGRGAVMTSLNQSLNNIKAQFVRINDDISNIDPQWSQRNPVSQFDIGDFAQDGALYYCIVSCKGESYARQVPAIMLTNPQDTAELAKVLRADVDKIRSITNRLQAAVTASVN